MSDIKNFDSLPAMITIKELAEYLNISILAAKDLISTNQIKSIKISERITRIQKEDLLEYLNSKK